jgi:hypothetical protein
VSLLTWIAWNSASTQFAIPLSRNEQPETIIMTEAAGLAASIIAILQLSETVVGYIREIVGAYEERKKLAREIISTKHVLSELKSEAVTPEWKATMGCLSAPEGPLDQLESVLKELETKLTPKDAKRANGKRAKIMKFADLALR